MICSLDVEQAWNRRTVRLKEKDVELELIELNTIPTKADTYTSNDNETKSISKFPSRLVREWGEFTRERLLNGLVQRKVAYIGKCNWLSKFAFQITTETVYDNFANERQR